MRWQERQNKIEMAVYEAIDELSEILSIQLPCYPEVFWLGRTLEFDDLALPEYLREELEFRSAHGISYYIINHKIVVIAGKSTDSAVLEEASHAFHLLCSGISFRGRNSKDGMCLASIIEAMGLLGARLIGSDLEDPYVDFPDLAALSGESQLAVRKVITDTLGDIDFNSFFIHQQGYGLGDRIYFKYLSGEISLNRIRKMFLSKFVGENGALDAFVRLKNEFWPRENNKQV